MKLDLFYIRIPLALLVVSLVLSASIYSASSWHEEEILSQFYTVERAFNTAKRQYEEANRNRSLYEQYLTNYLRLSEDGVIGEERRLNWIELLQNLDRKLGLPVLKYEIEAKKVAALHGVNVTKNINLYQSDMNLHLEVLHEGDFFQFFESLYKDANGFYSLRECELISKISAQGVNFSPNIGNVSADCKLSWITVMVND